MSRLLISIFIVLTIVTESMGQSNFPNGISYQAVVVNKDIDGSNPQKGLYLSNTELSIRISIMSDLSESEIFYQELHSTKTDEYGLMSLVIGQGSPDISDFDNIPWSRDELWLKVEIDINQQGTFDLFSIERFWASPYSIVSQHANIADSISNNSTAYQKLSVQGDSLLISHGNHVLLPKEVLDADSTNEIQTLNVLGDSLFISKGNSVLITHPFDPDTDSINEIQQLSRRNDSLYLSRANGVSLKDQDADTLNEIQNLRIENDSLFLSKSKEGIALSKIEESTGRLNRARSATSMVVKRPCYSAQTYFNIDSLLGAENGPFTLLGAFGNYCFIKSHGKSHKAYVITPERIVGSITMDSIPIATHFDKHFVGYNYRPNQEKQIFKIDTNGKFVWIVNLVDTEKFEQLGQFVGNYYAGQPIFNDAEVVDLRTGKKITIPDSDFLLKPAGYCAYNRILSYSTGKDIGRCKYVGASAVYDLFVGLDSNMGFGSEIHTDFKGKNWVDIIELDTFGDQKVMDRVFAKYQGGREMVPIGIDSKKRFFFSLWGHGGVFHNDFYTLEDYRESFNVGIEVVRSSEYVFMLNKRGKIELIDELWYTHSSIGYDMDGDYYYSGINTEGGGVCVDGQDLNTQFVILKKAVPN